MKWIKRGSLAVAALIVVIAGAGFLWLRTSLPTVDGEVRLPGLGATVEIIRDRDAVPHIRAKSERDAYMALGFVHAQDRLFQMEFMRRLGAGQISEVMGARAIGLDRMMRTLGLYRLAEESWEHLSPATRSALEAYADGVNAFLETRTGALPPEFTFLAFDPAPWRPADSIVWSRIMAMRLTGNWRREALRARLSARLGPARMEELWLDGVSQAPPTMALSRSDWPERVRAQFASLIDGWPDALAPATASNSWGLSGETTTTGKPILATDLPAHSTVIDVSSAVLTAPTPKAFAAGLSMLLSDPVLCRRLGERGLRIARDGHDYTHFRRKLWDVYCKLDHASTGRA